MAKLCKPITLTPHTASSRGRQVASNAQHACHWATQPGSICIRCCPPQPGRPARTAQQGRAKRAGAAAAPPAVASVRAGAPQSPPAEKKGSVAQRKKESAAWQAAVEVMRNKTGGWERKPKNGRRPMLAPCCLLATAAAPSMRLMSCSTAGEPAPPHSPPSCRQTPRG